MKERPILFNGAMVRAVFEGRKTQTRHVVKPQPDFVANGIPARFTQDDMRLGRLGKAMRCPFGQPGHRLWVRETFALEHCVEHDQEPPFSDGRPIRWADDSSPRWLQAHYKATDSDPELCCENQKCRQCRDHDYGPHWSPSIHMPRWASRITLEVTGVRVERLQDISEADASAEGAPKFLLPVNPTDEDRRHILGFSGLWESINGTGSWDANPWVWVIEFKRVEVAHG